MKVTSSAAVCGSSPEPLDVPALTGVAAPQMGNLMGDDKTEFLSGLFELIENQVQFGDNKPALLVAGDVILLAVCGGLIKTVSGCQQNDFSVSCMVPSNEPLQATSGAGTASRVGNCDERRSRLSGRPVALTIGAVAILCCLVPARRDATADPMSTLH